MMIISKTPLRISLVGGGTDLAAFYEKDPNVPGCVVSLAIDKYVYVMLNKKFDNAYRVSYSQTENVENVDDIQHDIIREGIKLCRRAESGLEIVTMADIPGEGTGLGSSSSLSVGLVNALNAYISGPVSDPGALAELGFITEAQKCGHPVGKQDHYAAAYGGLHQFIFKQRSVESNRILFHGDLPKYMVLLWTGRKRSAKKILREQSKNFSEKNMREIGIEMAKIAEFMTDTLKWDSDAPIRAIGTYLQRNWKLKKQLHPNISDEQIDFWYELGMTNGALGGKLCGAGGGGFLLFIAPPEDHARIIKATGLRTMPFKISQTGSEIIYDDQNPVSR